MKAWHSILPKNVRIKDEYWDRYTRLIPNVVIPYQWEILNDRVAGAPQSYCLQNFRIAAGEAQGKHAGTIFQDSDIAKWLEAVAYSLASQPNSKLESIADDVIALIGRAQRPDGYLNTYYTLEKPNARWQNLSEGHELYCAGHMIEAGVAYFEATGKSNLLDICVRLADLICTVFGKGEAQCHGYPGHPEIELALIKLARTTNKPQYIEMADYFVRERGKTPNYLVEEQTRPDFKHVFPEFKAFIPEYAQAHKPVLEQNTAEGHAVRAGYLFSAMADLAAEKKDEQMLRQCEALWDNIVEKRMYITGSIGSSGFFERFTTDYDLPNDSNYSETCASISLAMFGARMAALTRNAKYIDVVELALYNTVRAGISMQGDTYFYVNPLEVYPPACMEATSRAHVKAVRQKWFDVACCPTNVARTFTNLAQYMYGLTENSVYINLFIQNEACARIANENVNLRMETSFPRQGEITLHIDAEGKKEFAVHFRVPAYASNFAIQVDGAALPATPEKGYVSVCRVWKRNTVTIRFDITPAFVFASPLVRANCGKVALLRGPEVYCLEGCDNENNLAGLFADPKTHISEKWEQNLLGGTMVLCFKGKRLNTSNPNSLLHFANELTSKEINLKAVPYGSWGNRSQGEMLVWMHSL